MDKIYDIVYSAFVAHVPGMLQGAAYAIAAYTILGTIYCAVARKRAARPVTLKDSLSDMFPVHVYTNPCGRIDMWNWVLDKLLIGPAVSVIMALLSLGLSIDLAQLLTGTFGAHAPMLEATWAIVAIQFIVLLLGAELGGYIAHRLLHEVPLLWSIHRAHHSPEALNFFTNSRDHPLELLMNSVFRGVATSILLGVTLYVTGTSLLPQSLSAFIFFLVFIYSSYAYLSHSHIPMSFGKLNIVLAGPIMHQIHHSAEEHMFDKNYGRTIHIFDWMFGTLYMPRKGESFRFGLNDYSMGKDNPHRNLKQFYFEPFMHMAETWRGQRAAKRSETGKMVANGASDDRAEFPGVNN